MPITTIIPVVADAPNDTIVGQQIIFAILPTGGTQANFKGKLASPSKNVDKLERFSGATPGTGTLLTRTRTVVRTITRGVRITMDEFTSAAMTSFLNADSFTGTAKIWILDPNDAANKASLVSNEFSCIGYHEGEIGFTPEGYAEFGVALDVSGALTWTRDADTNV